MIRKATTSRTASATRIVVLEGHYGHLESNAHETPCLHRICGRPGRLSSRWLPEKVTLRLAAIKGAIRREAGMQAFVGSAET